MNEYLAAPTCFASLRHASAVPFTKQHLLHSLTHSLNRSPAHLFIANAAAPVSQSVSPSSPTDPSHCFTSVKEHSFNMADTRYVRFRYGPTVHTVAMYPGLPSEEFTMILKALLPVQVQGKIIGLQGEQGEVVPITLSCRSPEILRDSTYVLLVSGDSTATATPNSSNLVQPSAPPLASAQQEDIDDDEYLANIAPPAPPLKPSTNPVYDDELTADDAQEEDNTMDELLRFIAGLRVKRIINKTESDSLEELLFSNRYGICLLIIIYLREFMRILI